MMGQCGNKLKSEDNNFIVKMKKRRRKFSIANRRNQCGTSDGNSESSEVEFKRNSSINSTNKVKNLNAWSPNRPKNLNYGSIDRHRNSSSWSPDKIRKPGLSDRRKSSFGSPERNKNPNFWSPIKSISSENVDESGFSIRDVVKKSGCEMFVVDFDGNNKKKKVNSFPTRRIHGRHLEKVRRSSRRKTSFNSRGEKG